MLIELGHFALIFAFALALLQATLPLFGARYGIVGWMLLARPLSSAQFGLLAVAFATLVWAFVTSDFSVALVFEHSHTSKPLLYKITGVWGNHEGSLLLWVLVLALFGAAVAWYGQNLTLSFQARVLAIQGGIAASFLAFAVFASNPFERLTFPPFEGRDLNPLLQDPGLAFHPPLLYLGYVGLSIAFSFALAALAEGRVDAAWARWVRPWTLAAWTFLTLGIGLGSFWAYYELGWGGFWFWDPVENVSLVPWLFATALLHSAIVVEKRETLKVWTILLAILSFGFAILGTFVVRSGLLTSVHAFANDPERGVWLLLILGLWMGIALTLFALKGAALDSRSVFAPVSREGALVLNNVLLAAAAGVVVIGTLWPMVAELAFGQVLSVGPPFFNATFTPFMVALAIILPVGAHLAWKRGTLSRSLRQMAAPLALAVALGGLVWVLQTGRSMLAPVGLALGLWLGAGALADLWGRTGRGGGAARLKRLLRLPRAEWGKAVAHAGFGVTIFAISALIGWQQEDIRAVRAGENFRIGGYELTLVGVERVQGPNYISTMATIAVHREGRLVTVLHPERRFYPAAGMPTTEAAIHYRWDRDLYVTLGDPQQGGGWAIRSYLRPFATWLWAGVLIMAAGGVLSLSDRRYRLAVGARRQHPVAVAAE